MPKVCPECNQEYNDCYWKWCKPCQLNADDSDKVIEWIPYDKFQDIKQIAKGGYGTIYYAMWYWDIKNQRWARHGQFKVALKKFNGVIDINDDFLNEIAILLRTNVGLISTTLYGITKDPGTHEYMMVLKAVVLEII
ncbi:hypothetical protein Glove_212g149 [Diversispora epigaea]|uniref:Protein kinase domain-containing protein n=1 Tax=Diversispora epigaea TaxID=1348612 RepID=A0A397IMZ4_9GLOM|nr:hypothetical protein Glove_212g149 [Diversispora epigaea]